MTVLLDAAARAADRPGVYFMLGPDTELLYVGKARHLRRRLRQHGTPKNAPDRLQELYERVAEVRWRELPDDAAAFAWETDLIAALCPPYNAGAVELGLWTYLVVSPMAADRLSFALRSEPTGRRSYGCFPHLGKGVGTPPGVACTDGYTAFLRLLWAASDDPFQRVPTRLTRTPPLSVGLAVNLDLRRQLHTFLSGISDRLLANLPIGHREAYLQPGLRRDRAAAREFFAYGPAALRKLRLRHRVPAGPMTRQSFVELVTADAKAAVGEFTLSRP
jgi:hypothetical protein